MLWLLAQLVISSLPEAYPITLETLNWCAPALGSVLVSMAVLWMVALRHYITGPETGQSYVPAWLERNSSWCCTLVSHKGFPLHMAPATTQTSCTSVDNSAPSVAAEFTNSDLLKTW